MAQDASGAVFRVRDLSTGEWAALRRFFPSGGSGSGFLEHEEEGYLKTVEALKRVGHQSLRQVVGGGVDQVDGVPYLVTEWVEGRTLEEKLEDGPLGAEEAVAMVGRGLEALSVLQQVFGEEAEWVEMETEAVMLTEDPQDFRFWICPFQCLGVADRDGGVRGLGYLAERAMGWSGQVVPAGAAAGLGGWVAGAKAGEWSLEEAFAALVKVRSVWTGEELAPVMPEPAVVAPSEQVAPQQAAPVRGPVVPGRPVIASVVLLAGVVWALVAKPWQSGDTTVAQAEAGKKKVEAAATPVAKPPAPTRKMTPQEKIDESVRRATEAMNDGAGGEAVVPEDTVVFDGDMLVFTSEDGEALRNRVGAKVALDGVLFRVRDSNSGKTRYLEYSDDKGPNEVCCRIQRHDEEGFSMEELKALEGKKLRCVGEVQLEAGTGRVVVHLERRGQISVVE